MRGTIQPITSDGATYKPPLSKADQQRVLEERKKAEENIVAWRVPRKPWWRRSKYLQYYGLLTALFPAASKEKIAYVARVLDTL